MRFVTWLKDLSLRKKLLLLFALVGLVPLVVTFFVSYGEVRKYALEGLDYTSHQTYEQTLSTLTRKLSHIEEISSMIMVNETINSVLSGDPATMKVSEQLSLFDNVTQYTQILETNSELDHIVYYIKDEFVLAGTNSMLYRKLSQISGERWFDEIYENGGNPVWMVYEEIDYRLRQTRYLTLARLLWNPNNYLDPIGILMIHVDLNEVQAALQQSVQDQVVYVQTRDGVLVAGSGVELLETMRLREPLVNDGFSEMELDSGTYMVRGDRLGATNLYLTSMISQSAATETVNRVRLQLLVVYALLSIIVLILIVLITRSVTHRVLLLKNKMTQVRQGKLEILQLEPRADEIGHLVSSYNYMINSVKELMNEQYTMGQEKKGAELKALQSQINPHFLYNTLDMLIWMANKEETDNIKQVVYALSDYYKLVLSKGKDLVTVEEEVRLCMRYMEIQKRRFNNRLRFETEFEAAAMHCLLPKITLQPIVENAIVHGIAEKQDGKGTIIVTGRIDQERLVLSVEDDGLGMKADESKHKSYRGSGYGVINIAKRLELYFGEPDGIRFESEPGIGTRVTVNVPATRGQESLADRATLMD